MIYDLGVIAQWQSRGNSELNIFKNIKLNIKQYNN